jgi:hypothetical protein
MVLRKDSGTEKQTERNRETYNRKTERQKDRTTEGQRDRKKERQSYIPLQARFSQKLPNIRTKDAM